MIHKLKNYILEKILAYNLSMKLFSITINKKINTHKNIITVDGDKSISHRFFLIASQAIGISEATGILEAGDILNTINALKKLNVKSLKKNNKYYVFGNGLGSFKIKKNTSINCGNAGTLSRLLCGLLVCYPNKIKLFGDKSLNKRPMTRITEPLEKFGMSFYPINKKTLPLIVTGSQMPVPIEYNERIGSAQIKSALINASLLTPGISKINEIKKSRNHHEIMLKHAGADIKIKKNKKYNSIFIKGEKDFKCFNLKVPGDISSAAFFIALTILSRDSKIILKNICLNPTRSGIITILKKMNANIKLQNVKKICGEITGDIIVCSSNLKKINCPKSLVPYAIDEFCILMIVAAGAEGTSIFSGLSELNKKESPRLNIMNKILNKIGIKTIKNKDSIKIFGNPNLNLKNTYTIKSYMKDHRICMASVIAALSFGGEWKIENAECVATSFPSFYKLIKKIGGKIDKE